jgi:hypothetical protein
MAAHAASREFVMFVIHLAHLNIDWKAYGRRLRKSAPFFASAFL